MPCHRQTRHDDRNHRHELDKDIQRRARRILERIAHRVADDGRLVAVGALAAEVALLDHLLGVVPHNSSQRIHLRRVVVEEHLRRSSSQILGFDSTNVPFLSCLLC